MSLLQDAYRFVLLSKDGVEAAPLQIYTAALIFSPTKSIVRRMFSPKAFAGFQRIPTVDEDWSPCIQSFQGTSSVIIAMKYSHDGNWLALGSTTGEVRLCDAATGACVKELLKTGGAILGMVFSTKRHQLTSLASNGAVCVWDASHFTLMRKFCLDYSNHHAYSTGRTAFSADGQRLATTSGQDDDTIKIWDLSTGACINEISGHGRAITSVTWSKDGNWLASGSVGRTLDLTDMRTGACVWLGKIKGRLERNLTDTSDLDGQIMCAAISADNKWLAMICDDGTIELRHLISRTVAWTWAPSRTNEYIVSLVFLTDSRELVSAWGFKSIKVFNVETGVCTHTFDDSYCKVVVALSPDGQHIASVSRDHVKIWDKLIRSYPSTIEKHQSNVISVAYSADDKLLASASYDRTIRVWNAATGSCMHTLEGHRGGIPFLMFSPNSKHIASASWDRKVKIWDITTGNCLWTLEGFDEGAFAVAYSPDGHHLTTAAWHSLKVWSMKTGRCLRELGNHEYRCYALKCRPDGQQIASGFHDGTVNVWDMSTGECVQTLVCGGGFPKSLCFSPDGRQLTSSTEDGVIKVWDVSRGLCTQSFEIPHNFSVDDVRPQEVLRISFTSSTESELELSTMSGILRISPSNTATESADTSSPLPRYRGLGLSSDNQWVTVDGKRALWIPPDYRPPDYVQISIAIGSTGRQIGYGCHSGHVMMFAIT